MTAPNRPSPWDPFERDGEAVVRANLVQHVYGEDNERKAREWLKIKAQSRLDEAESRRLAASAEQLLIAQRANKIAMAAAIAATIAAVAAVAGVIISVMVYLHQK